MVELLKELMEILKTGGPYAVAAGSVVFVMFYHRYVCDREKGMRDGYREVIKEKETQIIELQGKIENIYQNQIAGLGSSVKEMTEALSNVHHSSEAVLKFMQTMEARR